MPEPICVTNAKSNQASRPIPLPRVQIGYECVEDIPDQFDVDAPPLNVDQEVLIVSSITGNILGNGRVIGIGQMAVIQVTNRLSSLGHGPKGLRLRNRFWRNAR